MQALIRTAFAALLFVFGAGTALVPTAPSVGSGQVVATPMGWDWTGGG